MKRLFEQFLKDEKDEYRLLIALIAVAVIVMVAFLGAWILVYT
ncbi:Flp family type IVb pilin [Thermicanus aegyptius]|nr:hypothetical protein [Thermicanus aegyptius]